MGEISRIASVYQSCNKSLDIGDDDDMRRWVVDVSEAFLCKFHN